jgi:hypothetical protein
MFLQQHGLYSKPLDLLTCINMAQLYLRNIEVQYM